MAGHSVGWLLSETAVKTTGEELLEAGDWAFARDAYLAELQEAETAAANFGLGRACRALGDTVAASRAWEQAYRLYVRDGAVLEAARVASAVAEVALASTGDAAVASGWLERARHHLRDAPEDPALAMVASLQAYVALAYDKDPTRARVFAEEALEHARRRLDSTAEVAAKAHLGLVLVSAGGVDEGMRLLDEATAAAVGGELSEEQALDTYCVLITACERVRDYARVRQWARQVIAMTAASGDDEFATFARTEYGHVLVQTGAWAEAEHELRRLADKPEARPVGSAMAYVFLSDMHARRGQLEQADTTLQVAEREPWRRAVRHLVMASRARLLLMQGKAQEATDLAQRYLRSVSTAAKAERVGVLETLVRASLAAGEPATAASALDELVAIAEEIPTPGVRAAAAVCTGLVKSHRGDLDGALLALQDALDLYDEGGMLPDVAATHVELARLHLARGDPGRTANEAERARHKAEQLGATGLAAAAAELLAGLRRSANGGPADLTGREIEVLRLVAAGATNPEIAERLVLSIRTVERHVSNVYLKIGATGASARVTATAYAHRYLHT